MQRDTIIIGAGLAGIGAAHKIPGAVIYEAKDHPGGHAYSHLQDGVHFDEGAHICHAKDVQWLERLQRNAGRSVRIEQSLVANYWHGHWVTYPVQNHLRDLPVEERIRALTEIIAAQRQPDRCPANYEEWCRYQYGDFLTDRFYREYTDKYWRTPMTSMDTDWLAGRLLPSQLDRIIHGSIVPLDEKQSVFSSYLYPASGGFFSFFRDFYRDVDIRLGHRVVRVEPAKGTVTFANGALVSYRRLISTMPLNALVSAIPDAPDRIRADASTLRHTQLIGINIVVGKPALVPHHWFYIYDGDIDVSRVKVLSNIIPDSLPAGKTVLQAEIYRRDDEVFDADALKKKCVSDLGRILGFDPLCDVESIGHIVVTHAYTIPTLGRQAAVDRISAWLESQGIITAGLYGKWKYVWSDQAYAAGEAAAKTGGLMD